MHETEKKNKINMDIKTMLVALERPIRIIMETFGKIENMVFEELQNVKEEMKKRDENVANMEAKLNELEEELRYLKMTEKHRKMEMEVNDVTTWAQVVGKSSPKVIEKNIENLEKNEKETVGKTQDFEGRERNLVITGVIENGEQELEEQVKKILEETEEVIPKVICSTRIGARWSVGKPRPIRITLSDKESRDCLIRAGRVLQVKGISARLMPDRTKAERKHIDELHKEAKKRNIENVPTMGKVWAVIGKLKPRLKLIDVEGKEEEKDSTNIGKKEKEVKEAEEKDGGRGEEEDEEEGEELKEEDINLIVGALHETMEWKTKCLIQEIKNNENGN